MLGMIIILSSQLTCTELNIQFVLYTCQWIGVRENLQEAPFFTMGKSMVSGFDFPYKTNPLNMGWVELTSHFLGAANFIAGDSDLCLAGTAEIPMAGWGSREFQADSESGSC